MRHRTLISRSAKALLTIAAACVFTTAAAQNAPLPAASWSGSYAGLNVGRIEFDGDAMPSGGKRLFGLHGGHMVDTGRAVWGIEAELDWADMDLGAAGTAGTTARIKLFAGRDLGRTLIYVTGGVATADAPAGSETGAVYGLGIRRQVGERYMFGAQILRHEFNDIGGTGLDAEPLTFAFRGSVRF